jgi:hypothetical protein
MFIFLFLRVLRGIPFLLIRKNYSIIRIAAFLFCNFEKVKKAALDEEPLSW